MSSVTLDSEDDLPVTPKTESVSDTTPSADDEENLIAKPIELTVDPENPQIVLLGETDVVIDDLLSSRLTKLGSQEFSIRAAKEGTYENVLYLASLQANAESDRLQKTLLDSDPVKDGLARTYRDPVSNKLLLSSANISLPSDPKGPVTVSGDEGIYRLLSAKKGNVKRIPLYNSGFCIEIRKPTPKEISDLLEACDLSNTSYGRMFGAHYYIYNDFILKENFIPFLQSLIVSATLSEGDKSNFTTGLIKFPDYSNILTSIAQVMYPNGSDNFQHACTAPENPETHIKCTHVETLSLNLGHLIETRYAKMSPKQIEHMAKARVQDVSVEEVLAYQSSLEADLPPIIFDDMVYDLKIPTLGDYLEAGGQFNADLLNTTQADNTSGIFRAIGFREMSLYVPWVKQITALDDNGNPSVIVSDKKTIAFQLNNSMKNPEYGSKLREPMEAFINRCQLTIISYPVFKCPACDHVPDISSGYFTVDPQQTFFTLAWQYLMSSSSIKTPSA